MVKQLKRGTQPLRNNAPELQKMEQDARRKQLIQAAGAICIKKKNKKTQRN